MWSFFLQKDQGRNPEEAKRKTTKDSRSGDFGAKTGPVEDMRYKKTILFPYK